MPPVQAELTALRLSSAVGLVTAPGEIFTEIGQSIMARSPFEHTLYATYTDGTIGYVPTRSAYAEGGYELAYVEVVFHSENKKSRTSRDLKKFKAIRCIKIADLFPFSWAGHQHRGVACDLSHWLPGASLRAPHALNATSGISPLR